MKRVLLLIALALIATVAGVTLLNLRDETPPPPGNATLAEPDADSRVATGEYLARVGNCAGCHTARGGAPFAGGRAIPTPFGVVHASNLTPDEVTGIGGWSADEFWRALHNGRSKNGRLLYPAFPYPNYTEVTREDSDALFAYLMRQPKVRQRNRDHALRFPYDSQAALAVWRALYFRPGVYAPEPRRDVEWNRGAYLVRGLGHCSACHSTRNLLGASSDDTAFAGGAIPMQGWYAPALTSNREAGLGDWEVQHIVDLLRTGIAPRASVLGPMAEVVYRSTQYLSDADARAIAVFLKSLPEAGSTASVAREPPEGLAAMLERGREIYEARCVDCHGKRGEGVPDRYPPLAGNRAVMLDSPANVIRAVLSGGYPPGTAGNPRPFGMPPFAPFLTDDEIAAVVTYVRDAWGNAAPAVQNWEVARHTRGAARE